MARSLAGPAQGSRRPGLEGGGPKTGKVATNPGVGSGPNLGTTRSWSNAARKLEKRGSRQRPAAADDWKNQYLSIISIVLKTACPSTPRSAAPGCLFCRRPPTCRPTGCPAGRRRLCRLLCRPLLPVGLSGVPLRRRRPAASRGCRSRLVAPLRPLLPAGLSGVPLRRHRPVASRGHRFRPVAAPVSSSRRPLGSSSPPTPTRRPTGCPVGRFFPSASREFLSADADPPPPGAAGLDWLPPSGRSFPPDSREFLSADTDPSPPGATGFDRLLRRSLLPAGHSH